MNAFFLFFKRIAVWVKGIPWTTSWYFGTWKGGANETILKTLSVEGDYITFKPLDKRLSKNMMRYFDNDLNALYNSFKKFSPEESGEQLQLEVQKNNTALRVHLSSAQSLFVFFELFEQEMYGFRVPSNCVVVDVGMNIGMASLYFSSLPSVQQVFSFELVPATYALAVKNIALNPGQAAKITAYPYGWAGAQSFFNMGELSSGATDTSIKGLEASVAERIPGSTMVEVKSAAIELEKILTLTNGLPVILKLDTEGVEYEILPALYEAGLLQQLQGIMLEWHHGGYEILLDTLAMAGFKSTFRPDPAFDGRLGMIYGWR